MGKKVTGRREKPSCCINCPYGRNREICFPCYKDLLGQEGIKAWKEKMEHQEKS
jgi:hypothetical protein